MERHRDRLDDNDEDNSEDGHAWTLAAFWAPKDSLRVGVELLSLRAERRAAEQSGADPNTDAWKATIELRLAF